MYVYVRHSLTLLGLLTLTVLVTNTAGHLGSCEDHSPECSKWESWGFCDTNLRFMAQNCPVTCNVCIDPDCFNRLPFCDSWESQGFCSRYAEVQRLCPHSCNLCHIPDSFLSNNNKSITQSDFECGKPVNASGPELGRTKRQSISVAAFQLDVVQSRSKRHDTGTPHDHHHHDDPHDGHHDHLHDHPHDDHLHDHSHDNHHHDHSHDHPHNQSHATVQNATNFRLDHCSPVLIHERFLLTSARCVLDPDEPVRQISLGSQNPVYYEVVKIIIHPNYKLTTHERYNDVALLQTKETIQFTEEIYPSCLSAERPTAGSVVIDNISDTASTNMEDDDLEIIDSLQCENIYKEEGIEVSLQGQYPNLIRDTDIFCADFRGSNKCERETKGALFQDISERRFLIGLVSRNASCTQPAALTLPGFYTSVANHIDFINNIIYP